jgi:hypothetical protein
MTAHIIDVAVRFRRSPATPFGNPADVAARSSHAAALNVNSPSLWRLHFRHDARSGAGRLGRALEAYGDVE